MKIPEDKDHGDPLTFFGLVDVLCDFERRLRELEECLRGLDMNHREHFHRIDEVKTGGSLIVRREES